MNLKRHWLAAAIGLTALAGCTQGEEFVQTIKFNGRDYAIYKLFQEDAYKQQSDVRYEIRIGSDKFPCGDTDAECRNRIRDIDYAYRKDQYDEQKRMNEILFGDEADEDGKKTAGH